MCLLSILFIQFLEEQLPWAFLPQVQTTVNSPSLWLLYKRLLNLSFSYVKSNSRPRIRWSHRHGVLFRPSLLLCLVRYRICWSVGDQFWPNGWVNLSLAGCINSFLDVFFTDYFVRLQDYIPPGDNSVLWASRIIADHARGWKLDKGI